MSGLDFNKVSADLPHLLKSLQLICRLKLTVINAIASPLLHFRLPAAFRQSEWEM